MLDNLYNALARLLRCLDIIASGILLFSLLVLLLPGFRFLEPLTRTYLTAFACLPSAFFVLAYYFYENRIIEPAPSTTEVGLACLTTIFLLIPSWLIGTRYVLEIYFELDIPAAARLYSISTITVFVLGLILGPKQVRSDTMRALFLGHLHEVMWRAWGSRQNRQSLSATQDDLTRRNVREAVYSDVESLRVFQDTLTCPTLDSRQAIALIQTSWSTTVPEQIDILDIGGGDGCFTAQTLRGLVEHGSAIRQILMIDPGEWEAEYRSQLGPIVGSQDRIQIVAKGFEVADINSQFHLVIASHSLYNLFDGVPGVGRDRSEVIGQVLDQVLALRKDGGLALVVLASGRGRAYRFKREAMELLFGHGVDDTVAEHLRPAVHRIKGRTQTYVDNLFNLSRLMEDAAAGRFDGVCCWLKYFLRYPIDRRTHHRALALLVERLSRCLIRFDELAEHEVERFRSELPEISLRNDSLVLPHKTAVWVIGP